MSASGRGKVWCTYELGLLEGEGHVEVFVNVDAE